MLAVRKAWGAPETLRMELLISFPPVPWGTGQPMAVQHTWLVRSLGYASHYYCPDACGFVGDCESVEGSSPMAGKSGVIWGT